MLYINQVTIRGRLTKDPAESYTAKTQKAVCRFTVAIDRGKDSEGKSTGADFINVVCYGGLAEYVLRRGSKGSAVFVLGKLSSGSYQKKDGSTVWFTEVVAQKAEVDMVGGAPVPEGGAPLSYIDPSGSYESQQTMEGFSLAPEDMPF